MIIGFHLTWTTYGHWFPNDPRGSWSDEVWKPELVKLRALDDDQKVTQPRPVSRGTLQHFLDHARSELRWNVVHLNEREIDNVGNIYAEVAQKIDLTIRACAILSNHTHLVIDRHYDSYERIVDRLKGQSSQAIRKLRRIPVAKNRKDRVPIWTNGYWSRYINHLEQMEFAIRYVQGNTVREGLKSQTWGFVARA